jgi:hypothetical protein
MKTETELILKSRRVVPKKLLESGFNFKFETWKEAAHNLCCHPPVHSFEGELVQSEFIKRVFNDKT